MNLPNLTACFPQDHAKTFKPNKGSFNIPPLHYRIWKHLGKKYRAQTLFPNVALSKAGAKKKSHTSFSPFFFPANISTRRIITVIHTFWSMHRTVYIFRWGISQNNKRSSGKSIPPLFSSLLKEVSGLTKVNHTTGWYKPCRSGGILENNFRQARWAHTTP